VIIALFAAALVQQPRVDAAVARLTPELTEVRHRIHQNPELSNREFETARLIATYLKRLGLQVDTGIAHTGVVGVLRGGRPGPVVAVRADMDALPVTEDTPYPFKSTKRGTYLGQEVGIAHACGHDIHVTVQLGVAAVLAGMKAELPGTVKFIFQPAEEGSPPGERGGATLMIEQGVLENPRPEVIFGLHTKASLDVGVIGYTPGPALAATDQFRAVIRGRQAHGSSPHLSIDPVVTAAQAIVALQTIRSRNLSPFEPSVVTVGMVRGGTRWNIIPGAVELEGTVRSYGAGVSDTVERRMREILAGITSAAGATYELTYVRYVPATVNDTVLTRRMVPSLARSVGAANARQIQPWMAGEDFSRYTNIIPGFFFMLGVQKPGVASGDHHAPNFMADDSAIPVGVKAMVNVVLDYLDGRGR
jgi:amidohydrolase